MLAMADNHCEGQPSRRWKGVRKRAWGKWVSEIRRLCSQQRIWLGSYASAEEAARAHDAAALCLHGPSASLNFPCSSIPPLLLGHSPSPRAPLSQIDVQSIAAAAAAAAAVQNYAAADLQNEEWTAVEPQALALSRQESQPPVLIPSQEVQAPMNNQMQFPSHEMQVSIQHQIRVPSQSAAPMHNQLEFPSQEMQASTQQQIRLFSQSAAEMGTLFDFAWEEMQASTQQQIRLPSQNTVPMCNRRMEFPSQEMQASTQQQIFLPSQSAGPMHNQIEFLSHEMQASTQHQICFPSESGVPVSASALLTPSSGPARITLLSHALPNPIVHTPHILHPYPSVHNSHLAVPAMAKHFRHRSQMRAANHSPGFTCTISHPFLELEDAFPLDKEDEDR